MNWVRWSTSSLTLSRLSPHPRLSLLQLSSPLLSSSSPLSSSPLLPPPRYFTSLSLLQSSKREDGVRGLRGGMGIGMGEGAGEWGRCWVSMKRGERMKRGRKRREDEMSWEERVKQLEGIAKGGVEQEFEPRERGKEPREREREPRERGREPRDSRKPREMPSFSHSSPPTPPRSSFPPRDKKSFPRNSDFSFSPHDPDSASPPPPPPPALPLLLPNTFKKWLNFMILKVRAFVWVFFPFLSLPLPPRLLLSCIHLMRK